MSKRVCLLLVLLSFGLTLRAQEDDIEYIAFGRALQAADQDVVKGENSVGWVRSHFLDDWFLQVQGGGQLYYGTDDSKGPFKDRLTANYEFQVGRRIFPMFGFRVGAGFGKARGFLLKDNLIQNKNGGIGECGTDANGLPLGGYYWDYNDDLLIQKWSYWYFGGDIFLDLALFRGTEGYNPEKKFNNIVYLGVHTKFSQSETDDKNHRTEAHLGYICKYNFNRHWSIYGDARLSAMERLFDREWIQSIESPGFNVDKIFNLHVGLQYKFYIRSEEERNKFTRRQKVVIDQKVKTISTTVHKIDTVYSVTHFDTLVSYDIQNIMSPDMQRANDSLLALIKANEEAGRQKWDEALKEILLNQLLPYEMVFFELDRWDVLPEEEVKIAKMATIMKAFPEEKFILTGSADSKTGTVARNQFLSEHRADTVYSVLVNKYGVNPDQLTRNYLGGILEYQPFVLNRTTVIIMDNPIVAKAFEEMKKEGRAGGGEVKIDNGKQKTNKEGRKSDNK